MDFTTNFLIKSGVGGACFGFVLGASYAAITKGPILLSGGAYAIQALFDATLGLIAHRLVETQRITEKKAVVMLCTASIISATALITAGIASGIIGPVGVCLVVAMTGSSNILRFKEYKSQTLTSFVKYGKA